MTKKLKRPLAFLLSLTMIMTMFINGTFVLTASAETTTNTMTPSKPATGDGTSDAPYEISSAAELYWFAGLVNGDASVCDYDAETNSEGTQQKADACAKLTANIVVNTGEVATCDGTKGDGWYDWTPIGKDETNSYKGKFDGQKFTVSGLYFNDSSTDHVGLFGYIYSSTIKNVGVTNSYFCGKNYVGGVCGRTAGTYDANSYVINCYNTGTVTGTEEVGGVCGQIFYCYEANCYNTGTVTGTKNVGGVCGYIWFSSVINCYNTGTVTGTNYVGGGYGYSFGGSFENSYYLAESANDNGGRTAEQFHSGEITFLLSKGGSVTADETYPASVWGQDLSTPDSLPVLNGKTVYKYCDKGTVRYSNEQVADVHDYVSHDGICPCGEGSPAEKDETDGYYKIENGGNLYWFAGLVNGTLNGTQQDQSAKAKLMTNIVVNEGKVAECNGTKGEGWIDWTPIGKDKTNSYQGTFDGQGYTISGLYFNDSKTQYVGLFGYITSSGYNISNVGVVNSYFYGYDNVGGVCGYMNGGGISNCYNASTVKSEREAGGICGVDERSEAFKKCYNTGNITSNGGSFYYVGGICGANTSYADSFINCYNTGTVNSPNKAVAGAICGFNGAYGSKILYCYNTGSVNGKYDTVYGTKRDTSNECSCYYLADADDGNGGKTEDQFKNGEVAYLLQGNQTEEVWGQNIDKAEPYDSMPVYGGEKVYKYCNQGTSGYSNTSGKNDHLYGEDGYCACGELEPANIDSTDGYYIIKNKGNLFWFAGLVNGTLVGIDKNVSANAKLENDITVNSALSESLNEDGTVKDGVTVTNWMPIGKDSNYYTGTFNGQNHTIKGLYFNDSDTDYIGLFGLAGNGANVSNITIEDSYLNGDYGVGGVCGYNNGIVKDCNYTGYVSGNRAVGGVCGRNDGTIQNCDNPNEIIGKDDTGGVCGYNSGTVKDCKNTGDVSADNSDNYSYCVIGGVCGCNSSTGTVENCDNNGNVSVRFGGKYNYGCYVGGVCGNNQNGKVINSHNTGNVSVDYSVDSSSNNYDCNVGGVCGYNYCGSISNGTIQNSHNTGIVSVNYSGKNSYACNVGGVSGYNHSDSTSSNVTIQNSHNTGNVNVDYSGTGSGECNVGGMSGLNNGTIANCFSVGEVSRATSETPVLGGVCGNNSGTVNNCYYDNEKYTGEAFGSDTGTSTNVEGMTTKDFGIGKAAYLLNQNDDVEDDVWGQNINNGKEPESYPVLGGATVYAGFTTCDANVGVSYTNIAEYQTERPPHDYNENGFCTVCDAYEPADLVENVYQIGNAGQLYWYVNNGNNHDAVLTDNIDINPGVDILDENGDLKSDLDTSQLRTWTPRSIPSNFDGKNHTISGLYFNDDTAENVGLFSSTGKNVTISNLGIIDSYFKGKNCVGGVIGCITSSSFTTVSITNCYNQGKVEGNSKVGGICGEFDIFRSQDYIAFTDCQNSGKVEGNSRVGGICGHVENFGNFKGCYNTGTVTSDKSDYVGGICGYNRWATLTNCYNTGSVTGVSYVGGVSGCYGTLTNCYNTGSVTVSVTNGRYVGGVIGCDGTLTNCYNKGTVTSNESDYVGGVIGYNKSDTIRNCYNTYTVTGRRYVGGVCGYNGKSGNIANCYNIGDVTSTDTSDDPSKGSICGFNETDNTIITNCYYLGTEETDTLEGTEFVTEERFHSGEIAFLLKYTQDDFAWGQDLSNPESYPELNSDQYPVYKICSRGDFVYSNNNSEQEHWTDKDGFCTVCGGYDPAVLTTDNYDIDGDGNYDEVYEISNAGQLYWFAGLVNGTLKDGTPQNTAANAVLKNNITVNKSVLNENGELNSGSFKDWTPIGDSTYKYTGKFDGRNCTISGLYFEDTQTSYVGLFGYISGENAKVYDLGILDSYFSGHYVGGVCGYNYCGTITGCHNKGTVASTGEGAYVGGVCGYNDSDPYSKIGSTFENCYNTGKVTSTGESSNVGGVCGYNYCSTITGCHNIGAVTPTGKYANVGGVCGYNDSDGYFKIGGTLENCYNTGTVTSTDGNDVGGVCGYNDYYSTIKNCYNESTVSGRSAVGGVCGYNYSTIQDCHSTGSVTSSYTAGGVCGYNYSTIQDCYNTSSVTGGSSAGGVCGYNNWDSTITNCHSTGNVTLKNTDSSNTDVYGGGVCGLNYKGTITNCYIIGNVTVTDTGSATNLYDGGVCGKNDEGTIANCYIIGDVTVENTGSITNSYDGDLCGSNETGTIANCYYLADEETDEIDGTTFKTEAQFNGGEVAYLISQGCTIGEDESAVTYDGSVWGQTLEGEDIQDSPVLGGKKVYKNTRYNCEFDFTYYYANTLDSNTPIDHKDDDSDCYCDYCGNIMSVNLTLTVPKDGEAMPSEFASLSNGISVSDFAIDGEDTTADYKKTYTVSANVNVSAEGKIILNTTVFSINGTAVTASKNEDGSYAVSFEFKPTVDLSVTANMENGAAIRLTNVNGLRFITKFDADKITRLKELGATVEIGTLIAPKDLLDGKDLTFESSKYVDVKYQATDENGAIDWHKDIDGQIAGSIVNIKENTESNPDSGNIARDFVGRGYVKVTLGDETVITYADYAKGENDISSVENNTRSLAYVADALKNDTEKYDELNDDVKALVDNWASKLANEQ